MRKILYVAAFSVLAASCNKDALLPSPSNTVKTETAGRIVELFDEETQKFYKFTFTDLNTPDAAYTYEVLDTPPDSQERFVALLKPEDYDVLPTTSPENIDIRLNKETYVVTPSNLDMPVKLAPGKAHIICRCKNRDGVCLVSMTPSSDAVDIECVLGVDCKKKCKLGYTQESVLAGSAIIYAK